MYRAAFGSGEPDSVAATNQRSARAANLHQYGGGHGAAPADRDPPKNIRFPTAGKS